MAGGFEDLYDLNNMSDAELKELVLQELSEYPEVDVDSIEVNVRDGAVTLAGRVGTEQEQQDPERILTEVLGFRDVRNELVIDEVRRDQQSEAADEVWQTDGPRTSDEAEHLMENLEVEQFGTQDPQEAIERGTTYEAPDRPVQEGSSGEQH